MNSTNSFAQSLQTTQQQLTAFAQQPNFLSIIGGVFGAGFDRARLAEIQTHWLARDFSSLPKIEIVDSTMALIASGAAKKGDVLVIYCAGLGLTDPPLADGAAAPYSPKARTRVAVQVTIGGVPAKINYSGLAPGYVGLYQVNAEIPSGAATGEQPLLLTTNGVNSNIVKIGVR